MKLLKSALLASAFVGLSSLQAFAVSGNPLNTNADVTIVGPITITETQNLKFGKIVPPPSSYTDVTVDNSGAISQTGSGVLMGGHQQGKYDFSGESGASYTITTTPGSCGGTGLSLTAVTHDAATTLDQSNVGVGGTLRVDNTASSDPGAKQCAYTVAANY